MMRSVKRSTFAGFSLVELLVSLVLGVLLVTAAVNVLLGNLQTFRTTESSSRMQENGRFIIEQLRRDIRHAGYYGCRYLLVNENPRGTGALDPGLIRNTLNPAPPAAPAYTFDFTLPVIGYERLSGAWSPALPTNTLITSPLEDDRFDILVVSGMRSAGVLVDDHPPSTPPGQNSLQVSSGHGLEVGDIVMVSDCTSAAIFQITSTASDNIAHTTGSGTPGNHTDALGRSFSDAEVHELDRAAFYVTNDAVTGRPSLFRNDRELVPDVEGFRVFFGIDNTLNRRVDEYVPASGVTNWANVLAVRVELLLSSGEADGFTERPVSLPFAGGTFIPADADDSRLYQVYSVTVGLRNRLP